jgi:hypothetical protein
MVTSKSDTVSSFAKSMSDEIAAVTEPVTAASQVFLKDYNDKLDALLAEVTGESLSSSSSTIKSRSTLASTGASSSSNQDEEVVGHKEVGVGAWISSLVTMGAVLCGVFFESQRSKYQASRY